MVVKGRVDRREDQPRLMAMDLILPDVSVPDDHRPLIIEVSPDTWTEPLVERVKTVLARHPGDNEVHLRLVEGRRTTLLRVAPVRVTLSAALKAELKVVLGPGARIL